MPICVTYFNVFAYSLSFYRYCIQKKYFRKIKQTLSQNLYRWIWMNLSLKINIYYKIFLTVQVTRSVRQKITLGRVYEGRYCGTSSAVMPAVPVISQKESIFDQWKQGGINRYYSTFTDGHFKLKLTIKKVDTVNRHGPMTSNQRSRIGMPLNFY